MKQPPTDPSPFTIVSLAAVAWDFPLVGRTRMLSESWHRAGQPAIFVEAPHSWRSAARSILKNPPAAPIPTLRPRASYPVRFWGKIGESRIRRDMIRRAAGLKRRLDKYVDWKNAVALIVSPAWQPWLERLPFSGIVYDCIDDLAVHAPQTSLLPLFQRWERDLIMQADGAIATAAILERHIRSIRTDLPVEIVRNGVEVARFDSPPGRQRPGGIPAGRPVVGFVGALYEWIDFPLIESCVRQHPEITFVFIGPGNQPDAIARIAANQNAAFLGPRRYADVPAYVASFDICWVPFSAGAVTSAANPIKVYEYLAAGKPVITTAVADAGIFGDLVHIIADAAGFARAIAALTPDTAEQAHARKSFARASDWSHRAAGVADFIRQIRSSWKPPAGV